MNRKAWQQQPPMLCSLRQPSRPIRVIRDPLRKRFNV